MNKKIWISLALASAMTMMTACSSDSNDNSEGAAPHDPAFITTWDTGLDDTIEIDDGGDGNYTIEWGDGTEDVNISAAETHTYSSAGKYTVKITGDFRKFHTINAEMIISIDNWGDMEWTDMNNAFSHSINLQYNATDAPNLSGVTDMSSMFMISSIDGDLSDWNTSNVEIMQNMFARADKFNGDISTWDTGKVTTMVNMFEYATAFNQDISNWNTSKVITMDGMFESALSFDQNISDWNVSNVEHNLYFDDNTLPTWEASEKPDWSTANITP